MKQKKELFFIDKQTGRKVEYINLEELKSKHTNDDYSVIGEICIKKQEDDCKFEMSLDESINLHVQSVGTYTEMKYKTMGYIPCEENEYIAVKKKKSLLLWLIPLFLVLLLLLGGVYLFNNQSKPDIDTNAGDYTSALKRPENIDDSQILVPGYKKFTLKKGSDTIDTVFFNPEGNPCYFKVTLIERETGDVLYESRLIPPAQGITPIKLNKTFDKTGTYHAVLQIRSFDFEDTDIEYNGSNIEVDINVVE